MNRPCERAGSRDAAREAAGPPRRSAVIAGLALAAIALSLSLHFTGTMGEVLGIAAPTLPLLAAMILGGGPLVFDLLRKVWRREFGSDLLAGLAIVTAALLGEYLAGTFVVLMLSGGATLEAYAVRRASSVLNALARRMPSLAHLRQDGGLIDVPVDRIAIGDQVVIFPHEICPVDGTVIEGHGAMDEAYLTGEPYVSSKTAGSSVLSGAINGAAALTIRADKVPADSRYAKIMHVMRESEQRRPRMRRLGDQLGALYTPFAVLIASLAWVATGQVHRFLAVLVIATPCPLLIAIPVAIIGSISLAARRGIIIKDPSVLELVATCRTAIFDKTGTLTYGRPRLTHVLPGPAFSEDEALSLAASLERYSKHPLAEAVLSAAQNAGVILHDATEVSEPPGQGLRGLVKGRTVVVTSRKKLAHEHPHVAAEIPPSGSGLECVVVVDGRYAATLRFRDEPRSDGAPFVQHLSQKHRFDRLMLISGDRESEVKYLAGEIGISEVHAGKSPEEKLELVRQETRQAPTFYLGDGINDAPALTAATVGVAFGQNSDITSEAAGAVILESSLSKVDEFLHISRRLRSIALQSAIGGMALSAIGMAVAAAGYLEPVAGAVTQEIIDVIAVANALRVAIPPKSLSDYTSR
jgi:heavy metal translocating P-type ATPase